MNYLHYFTWTFKRYIWQLILAASLMGSLFLGTVIVQQCFAFLFIARLTLDVWQYTIFNAYPIKGLINGKPRSWEEILDEFRKGGDATAFRLSRDRVCLELENIMTQSFIAQHGNNNLCGPIAFLNFLIQHNPALFMKTACEYFENGCTYSPFYLQSSLWDRFSGFNTFDFMDSRFFFQHYSTVGEILAAGFKNTHNLLGFNNACFVETFRGSTEPKLIEQWLSQAGYTCTSNVTLNNYANTHEMPFISRLILGGVYGKDNKTKGLDPHKTGDECYVSLKQVAGGTTLHYLFNISSSHWAFSNKPNSDKDVIQIHLNKHNR
jgi:hypothetical protein